MKPGNVFAAPQMVQVAVVISPPSSSDIKILRIILFEVAAKSASRFFHSATMCFHAHVFASSSDAWS
jgi:hypothetical protein